MLGGTSCCIQSVRSDTSIASPLILYIDTGLSLGYHKYKYYMYNIHRSDASRPQRLVTNRAIWVIIYIYIYIYI